MKDPIKNTLTPKLGFDSPVFATAAHTTTPYSSTASSSTTATTRAPTSDMTDSSTARTGLRSRMPIQQHNSPHQCDHRRPHLHISSFEQTTSLPEGLSPKNSRNKGEGNADASQPQYRYNKDGILVPVQKQDEQTWSSFLIQHQLALSCSVILAVFASHALIVSKEIRDGHNVDIIGSLSAMIPPPLWKSLPASWTRVGAGGSAMIKKWKPKLGAFNPNDAWSSQAMALQYQTVLFDEVTGQKQVVYGKGWNDLYMVFVWVMIWTAIREAVMTFVLIPMGRSLGVGEPKRQTLQASAATATANLGKSMKQNRVSGSTSDAKNALGLKQRREEQLCEAKLLRFAEQGWLVIYDGCMWTFGMCLLYNSPYWSDSTFFWRDYPKTYLDATMKWYYLVQFAFWVQQFLLAILGIEKRRKDFLEFMIHHIITCLLIGFSYSFNLTSIGHAVLCAMDFSDIVLAGCKMLKYCKKDKVADIGFVFFVVTWIYTRHIWYGQIIWATMDAPRYATMEWDPSKGLYFTINILRGFQVLLCGLYAVLVFWLAMIFKVVFKVLKGENSEDVRSEDEDEAEVETEVADSAASTSASATIAVEDLEGESKANQGQNLIPVLREEIACQ